MKGQTPRSVNEYLLPVPREQRAALEKLRTSIKKLLPTAEESISYGLPAFRVDGQVVVGFGAAAKHCAFYPWSGSIVKMFEADLAGYSTSKGTIRFQPDHPIPVALVKKIVKARLVENRLRAARRRARVS